MCARPFSAEAGRRAGAVLRAARSAERHAAGRCQPDARRVQGASRSSPCCSPEGVEALGRLQG
eukprot:4936425-Lingulodinium_polyedra.AAC.1